MKNYVPDSQDIIDFWFAELTPDDWWKKSPHIDRLIEQRFGNVHRMAVAGELSDWRTEPVGRLAEIIVLDQFSRNMYRGSALAFANDGMALILAQEAVWSGADRDMNADERAFLYMPYMHSESPLIHTQAVKLFSAEGMNQNNLDFEMRHKAIIDRFGRYPHRNEVCGRPCSDEELEFLAEPGSSF